MGTTEQDAEPASNERSFVGESGRRWSFDIDKPLGHPGGFGGVFAGWSDSGETPVAIKVVAKRPAGREPLDERLLRREVEIGRRTVSELGGDALLLPVLDAGEDEEALLLVMTRASDSLAQQALPLDLQNVISVLTDVATGLQQLHSIGIIHRDLKPANILLYQGHWRLADFGIARVSEIGTQSVTFVGWGSTPYMSPELWQMRSPTVKSDLYALGCIAFQLLTGQPPFHGDNEAIRRAHSKHPVPRLATPNGVLNDLVVRLLAKDPGDRPQDARAVLERLARASRPRSADQEAVARALGAHRQERAAEAAARAAAAEAAEAHRALVVQATADLTELLRDAADDLLEVDPDIQYYSSPLLRIASEDASLAVTLWRELPDPPVPDDTMITAGAVTISNRRVRGELIAANVVYEMVGDRLSWQLYRFRAGIGAMRRYEFGPDNRDHGFQKSDFLNPRERVFMLRPAMHVWHKESHPLTAELVVGLFLEAAELRPDPETRRW